MESCLEQGLSCFEDFRPRPISLALPSVAKLFVSSIAGAGSNKVYLFVVLDLLACCEMQFAVLAAAE